jgi:pyroglutamyl-peptidase
MVAEALAGSTITGETVDSAVLPVTLNNIRSNIEKLIDNHQPRFIVCLGLAPGEPMVRIEKLAVNQADFQIGDNNGDTTRAPLLEDGPTAFEATLPVHHMCDDVLAAGLPARVSYTAGTFLCNAVSYYALNHCAVNYPETKAGFIHLPYLPSQVRDVIAGTVSAKSIEIEQRSDLASMAFEQQKSAVQTCIQTCVSRLN